MIKYAWAREFKRVKSISSSQRTERWSVNWIYLKEMEQMSHKHIKDLTDLHNFYEKEMINYKLL